MKSFMCGLGCSLAIVAAVFAGRAFAGDSDFSNGIQVDSVVDAVDSNPGDGICDDGAGQCTLRAAVQEANLHAGEDTIDLTAINDPNNPIILSLNGVDETWAESPAGASQPFVAVDTPDPSIGDLDITDSVKITGAGRDLTVIQWSAASRNDDDPATGDRIFEVIATNASITATISELQVRNGSVGVTRSTDPSNVYNIQFNSDGTIWQFKRFGGGICLGTCTTISLFRPGEHGGGGGGGGGGHHGGGHEGGHDESGPTVESATLTNVAVVGNFAGADGGGLYSAVPLTIERSLFWGNEAGTNGGAIYNSATMNMIDTTLGTISTDPASTPNKAENGGGLFDSGSHTSHIIRSAINGNSATGGGGIGGRRLVRLDIVNSTISNNNARDIGGGITTNGTASLLNATVAGNATAGDADFGGGGLNSFAGGTYLLKNTLLADNTVAGNTVNCGCTGGACQSQQQFISLGNNLDSGDACGLTENGDQSDAIAYLKPLGNYGGPTDSRALSSLAAGDAVTSPAIDAGNDNGCPNNDQRGGIRPADGDLDGSFHCDIGAYELFVHTADVHIQNMVAADWSVKDNPLAIRVEIHNGPGATAQADGVTLVTDPLDGDLAIESTQIAVAGTTSTCGVAGQVITCDIGTLPINAVATAIFWLKPTVPGLRTVTAHVTSTSPADPMPGNNTAGVTTRILGSADLTVTGSFQQTRIMRNQRMTGVFIITNQGPHEATEPRFAGTLEGDVSLESITSSSGFCRISEDGYLCELDSLAPGDSAVVRVSGTPTAVGALTLSVSALSSPEQDPVPSDNYKTVSGDVMEAAATPTGEAGNGGCAYSPGSPFDPTLLILAGIAIAGLGWRQQARRR
ncbi:MAG: choice-of-anchor Q domain-containing protein [Gammaproteobacteria bacterium]|jgi:CSLREA domain-containing protein